MSLYADEALVLALIVSVVCTILALVFIMPEKRRERLTGVWRFLHDLFQFRWMIVEKLLKGLYLFGTLFFVAFGFFLLFTYDAVIGVFLLLLAPIALRLVHELVLLFVMLVKNVMELNGKLSQKPDRPAE